MADVVKTLLLVIAALSLAGCGSDPAPECTFNSDCPSGEYCDEGACTADCTDDAECEEMIGAGAVCSSFGMCVAPPDAGPSVDAAVIDSGPPPPRDAGQPDAPADAPVDARVCAAAEVCTPSVRGATIADEDCDGAIDEDCPWYFGRPHWLTRPLVTLRPGGQNMHFYPVLSADGRRLYFTASDGFAGGRELSVHVVERATTADEFGAPTALAGADFATHRVATPALSPDELEGYFAASPLAADTFDIYRATRASRSDPFGSFVRVDALSRDGSREEPPYLSPDGLEMIVPSDRQLMRSTRTSTTAEWSLMAPIDGFSFPSANTPSMTPDGRVMFFYGFATPGRERIYYAERADPTTGTFGTPVEATALLPGTGELDIATPFVSLATREIFYEAHGGAGWTASVTGLWRAQICRDDLCANVEIPCPPPGVRSPDGLHCYTPSTADATFDVASGVCGGTGAHLPTLHSDAERDLVYSLRTGTPYASWIGAYDDRGPGSLTPIPDCRRSGDGAVTCGFAWVTGEAWTFAPWGSIEPNEPGGEDCAAMWRDFGSDWVDISCAAVLPYACEDELWPTW